jgi:hypothetical protein
VQRPLKKIIKELFSFFLVVKKLFYSSLYTASKTSSVADATAEISSTILKVGGNCNLILKNTEASQI